MEKKYYLGLDMGTNSVGWAVTDSNYNLLRAKGKDLWGIREFDEASPAADRRTARISRRRRQREVARLGLVKNYFADAIEKVDTQFFLRLENSKFFEEDKDEKLEARKYSIFNDPDYTDLDYYREFPTVFHLRKELLDNEHAPYDVRLVYLAVSNMFKHRGHFLLSGVEGDSSQTQILAIYAELVQRGADSFDLHFPSDKLEVLMQILGDKDLGKKKKEEKILETISIPKTEKKTLACIKLLCGMKAEASTIFDLDLEEKYSICFHDFSYQDKIPEIMEKVGEDNYGIIEMLKAIYDRAALDAILEGHNYLSEARVESYEKHQKDLALLKNLYKKYKTKEDYDFMFRSEKEGTYSAYVNSFNSQQKSRRNYKKRSSEDLYANIKKAFEKNKEDSDVLYILEEMEKETFLPKQLTGANGVIPNQVHKKELVKILGNAEEYLPFLKETDDSGLTVSQRIVQLFSFQIPYFVGPLGTGSKTGWAVRKDPNGAILPWNLEEKIDMEKTSEKFIQNLVRECTYLNDEKVLPKNSLIYEAYCVLNEINNIRIDGERIEVSLKQKIYKDLFESGRKITRKKLGEYLIGQGAMKKPEQLTGVDVTINNSLSSFGKMYAIFGEKLREDSYRNTAEEIIYWGTIYGDSKSMLKKKLQTYVEKGILTKEQVSRIAGYKFKDWGRMSRAMLELQGCDKTTGEEISLIRAMWENNLNFMELINSDLFTFKQALEDKKVASTKLLADFEFEDLNDFYFSAPVKRMIWQTILVIRELVEVLGSEPERIFIEMTRTDEEKGDAGRKNSRGKDLIELYKSIKDKDGRDWKAEIKEADENGSLRSKKLFLYYTQMGRDAYTGDPIELEDLFTNKYDLDHIYPRHYVKDDSLINNLVLVNKTANEHLKKDMYPIPQTIVDNEKVKALWDTLHAHKLISDEKYQRLTCRKPFTEEQLAGFIARQMVETGQGTKGVADLLKALIPTTTIVYSKAGNVSDFRRQFGFPKSRLVNEFHHANDAYLNIVVGNVYFTKFTSNPINFIRKDYAQNQKENHYSLARMFDWNVKRGEEVAWIASTKNNEGTLATVRKVMNKNTPLMTRMNFEKAGAIAKATLYSAKEASPKNYISIKGSEKRMADVTKYGGLTGVSMTYFFIVESEIKGEKQVTIEGVPLYLKNVIESKENGLEEYCQSELKLENPRILVKKLRIQSLLKVDGYYYYLSGKTENRLIIRNAVNLKLDRKWIGYIKKIEKLAEKNVVDEELSQSKNEELYILLCDKFAKSVFKNRFNPVGEKLNSSMDKFKALNIESQCKILYQILHLSNVGLNSADLTLIGGASKSGVMLMSKKIDLKKGFEIINQSPTGLFEHIINVANL